MSSGTNIINLRKNKGYSQERLAEEAGVSIRTVQRIESGATSPTGHTLALLAGVLDTSVENLINEKTASESPFELVNKMNLSALPGLVLPYGNLIIPFLQWRKHQQNTEIKEMGKRILNFQLLWSIAATLCFILVPMLHYVLIEQFDTGRAPLTWIVFAFLVIYNVYKTLKTSLLLKQEISEIYPRIPSFI
ncbi:MAG: helix-turn-helix domain-containing protein [Roseivirga sp.]|nr:helix-turn-helix domain-containing protein [Roseivirga sp.]